MNKRHTYKTGLGEVVFNRRHFFAWKDGFWTETPTQGGDRVSQVESRAKDKVRDDLEKGDTSSTIKYRLIVGGSGMVYEGKSKSEAKRRFKLFVIQSKTAGSGCSGEAIMLFKNYEKIEEYRPADHE
jgi:hypothetical protein